MGTFTHTLEVGSPDRQRFVEIEALVDTGATYTWLPASTLHSLGIEPSFTFPFVLADGREIQRDMAEAPVRLDGQVRTTLVVFGDEGTRPLLGAYTLEAFGLTVDTVNRRLVTTPGLLL